MFTLQQILDAIQPAAPHGLPDLRTHAHTVSTDTRTLAKGDLFVALTGESFDGHAFVRDAVKAGAVAAVVSEEWYERANKPRLPLIVVHSPLAAYGMIARAWRRQFNVPVVCIAGSNGKTATKEMTALVLAEKFRVLKTPENNNNQIGVPQTLLTLTKKHTAVVLEIGSNHSGEIAALCRIAEPTHGVITTIGRDHLAFLRSIEGVAGENGDLFGWLGTHQGTAFVNGDDKLIKAQASYRGLTNVVEYGFSSRSASIKGKRLGIGAHAEPRFSISVDGKRAVNVELQAVGEHNTDNALAAAAIGVELGVPLSKAVHALEAFVPDGAHAYARLRLEQVALDGPRGRTVTVLNDTYNATPDSVYAALETLFAIKTRGRHVAVLGDMLELGDASRPEHDELGRWLLHSDIDEVFLYGADMYAAYESIKNNRALALPPPKTGKKSKAAPPKRMKSEDVATSYFPMNEKQELVTLLWTTLHNDDVVLVKGSRGVKMEEVILGLKRTAPAARRAGKTTTR